MIGHIWGGYAITKHVIWDLSIAASHYMHICTKSIQIYFGIFFDFIPVLLSFHCSHTILIFSEIFPIFPAILFTSKACHFDTALLILLPFKCLHSHALCRIKSYHTQCTHSLRHTEQSWHRGRTGYMWDETFTRISHLSVLTVTEEFLLAKYSKFLISTAYFNTIVATSLSSNRQESTLRKVLPTFAVDN